MALIWTEPTDGRTPRWLPWLFVLPGLLLGWFLVSLCEWVARVIAEVAG